MAFSSNNLKVVANEPEAFRAIQHHQIMRAYGLTPDYIDAMPYRDVQLLRMCLKNDGKHERDNSKKQQFYQERDIQPASMGRI